MTERVWKHLPYAIYLDTNVLRASGSKLDAPWINELLSITTSYGISLCISELVLAEWCEYLAAELEKNRQRLFSSADLLGHFGISVAGIRLEAIDLPDKNQLAAMVAEKLRAVGIGIVPDWDAPLRELLGEAIAKKPPFEDGGKGLCDAVIVESYALHASKRLPGPRVLVVSRDSAVKRSGARFTGRGIAVDFLDEQQIVAKLKSLLDDEVAAFIEKEKRRLKEFVMSNESQVLAYVNKTPLKLTERMLDPLFGEQGEDLSGGTIEGILSITPTKITDVIGGAPPYGEKVPADRYPLQISVELEIGVLVRDHGLGFALLGRTRATIQPDAIDGTSPVPLEWGHVDRKGRETTKTIRRTLTVLATLDAEKQKRGVLEDLRIERIL